MTVPPLCKVIISIVGKRKTVCYNVRRNGGEYEKTKEISEKFNRGIAGYHAGRHSSGLRQGGEDRRYNDSCRLPERADLAGTLKPDG